MKRVVVGVVLGAFVALTAVVALRKYVRDPETSNPADLAYEKANKGVDAGDGGAPEFFVSDSNLLVKAPYPVEAQMTDEATGKGVPDAPYFVELADGRYAFGYADRDGRTRTLFTQTPVKYSVFWYDEAWEHWEKRRARPSDARQQ